jgi:hypothetical protein
MKIIFTVGENRRSEFTIIGAGDAYTLADAVSETLRDMKLIPQSNAQALKWSQLVNEKVEFWPVQLLLPGGAYVH